MPHPEMLFFSESPSAVATLEVNHRETLLGFVYDYAEILHSEFPTSANAYSGTPKSCEHCEVESGNPILRFPANSTTCTPHTMILARTWNLELA